MIIEAEDKRQLAIQLAALQAKGIKVEPPYQVHVPDYTEIVHDEAFAYSEVGQIVLPNSATEIGRGAVAHCEALAEVVLPKGLAILPRSAFAHCEALTEVLLPKALANLPCSAFSYSGIVSLHLPQRVSTIHGCIAGCRRLQRLSVSPENEVFDSREDCNAVIRTCDDTLILGISTTVIPETVAAINHYAFRGCPGLTSITIPDNVSQLKEMAFYDCPNLSAVSMPAHLVSTIEQIGKQTQERSKAYGSSDELVDLLAPAGDNPSPFQIGLRMVFADCPSLNESGVQLRETTSLPTRKERVASMDKQRRRAAKEDQKILEWINEDLYDVDPLFTPW